MCFVLVGQSIDIHIDIAFFAKNTTSYKVPFLLSHGGSMFTGTFVTFAWDIPLVLYKSLYFPICT